MHMLGKKIISYFAFLSFFLDFSFVGTVPHPYFNTISARAKLME